MINNKEISNDMIPIKVMIIINKTCFLFDFPLRERFVLAMYIKCMIMVINTIADTPNMVNIIYTLSAFHSCEVGMVPRQDEREN